MYKRQINALADGLVQSAKGHPRTDSLTHIGLADNYVTSRGLVHLMLALTRVPLEKLQSFNLASNQIGADGVKAMVRAIQSGALNSLKEAMLDNNPGSSKPIAKAIEKQQQRLERARARLKAKGPPAAGSSQRASDNRVSGLESRQSAGSHSTASNPQLLAGWSELSA